MDRPVIADNDTAKGTVVMRALMAPWMLSCLGPGPFLTCALIGPETYEKLTYLSSSDWPTCPSTHLHCLYMPLSSSGPQRVGSERLEYLGLSL